MTPDVNYRQGLIGGTMLGLFRRKRHERAGFVLYNAAVRAGRDPWFYTALGVPDTLDGRFDMVGLHAFLIIDRLQAAPEPGPGLAQALFDAMFADMDFNLREMGVGDMSVGKRVKEMWEAFHGRSVAYAAALQAADLPLLSDALARNVWRGTAPEGASAALAQMMQRRRDALAGIDVGAFNSEQFSFPDLQPVPA